jgi:cation diffusion facilitator family transporter
MRVQLGLPTAGNGDQPVGQKKVSPVYCQPAQKEFAMHLHPDPRLAHASHGAKARVALLSVVSNALLVAAKLIIGILTGSVSIISEAIHSAVDLVAALIAFVSVRASAEPADAQHPFGHGKFENISGAVEALLIFVAAGWIIWEAVHKIIRPQELELVGWGIGVMLVSAVANWLVSRRLFRVGEQTDSVALKADAWHLRTDVYTSVGVMVGLAIVWTVERWFPQADVHWVDPVVALAVALLIIKAAWDLTAESVRDLLDARLPEGEEALIRAHIAALGPAIRGFHGLRTRKAGATRFVQVHVVVDPAMSVHDSHELSDALESAIMEHYPAAHVTVHVEPCVKQCTDRCLAGCLMTPTAT